MTEAFIMSENNIPDGMLHDQELYEITLQNKVLTLSFNINLDKEEYGSNDFAKKYFAYKKCHIRCCLGDEFFCCARLETTQNKHGKGTFQYLSVRDFVKIADREIKKRTTKGLNQWEYLYTYVSPDIRNAKIELSICSTKYKRTDYSMCTLELETEKIEYIWE